MILIVESALIIVLTGLNLFQYRRNRELLKGISVVTEHVDQEYDTFNPILHRTNDLAIQNMIISINALLLQKYRLFQKCRDVQEQYRTSIADISHDLKTPITTLSGYIDLSALKYRQFGNDSPEVNHVLRKAKQKSQEMQHIILQQLDLARICSRDAEFPVKRIDLTELCREVALSYYDCLHEQEFQVYLDLNDSPIYATTSPDGIRCIMQNLIDNSIEYGGSGKFLGMRQRLAIARAILTYPELLILDEPTNALDPEGIKDMRTLFRDINLNYGTTIIISSHILSEMEHLADWIGIIDQHRIVQEKTMDEIKKANRDHLTISVDDVKKSCVILEHLGITDFTVQENNSIRIYQNTDPSIIAKKLVNAGVSLYELSQANRTLEDHFFEVLQNGGGI